MLSSYTSNPILNLTWTPAVHARLVVTTGCSVVSIEGPEKTFIVGAPDDTGTGDSDGLGPEAVKGVFLGPNTRLSGFTVTGGTCVFDCVVTGGGLLTVLLNGETFASLTSADGAKTFEFRNALTENVFTFRYEALDGDTGGALVSNMAWNLGSILRVR